MGRGETVELTRADIVAMIEREAMNRYKLTAAQFVAQVRSNTFDVCSGAADLMALAQLLPKIALFLAA